MMLDIKTKKTTVGYLHIGVRSHLHNLMIQMINIQQSHEQPHNRVDNSNIIFNLLKAVSIRFGLGLWFLTPLSTIFHCEFEFCSWLGVLDTTLCDKFVSGLRQIGGFLWILQFPPPIKLTATI
jgi:hypothetical protein